LRNLKQQKMAFSDDEEDYDADTVQETRKSYEGEDTSPTSERELKGWYAYPIAAEVFAVVAVGTYHATISFTLPYPHDFSR
jgi:UMF1 family MFS transporter